jgi:hypothetical protein
MRLSLLGLMPLLLAPATRAAERELVLVRDGAANSVIVVGSEAPSPAYSSKPAALLIQRYLKKVSGAEVPVVDEASLKPEAVNGKVLVLVGDGKRVRELGLRRDGIGPEGFHLKTVGDNLVILGGDERNKQGTRFGALAFLERSLGVRWLMPFDTGEVVPKQKTVTIAPIDFRDEPKFRVRHIRNGFDNGGLWEAARPYMGDPNRHEELYARGGKWYGTQRLAFGVAINGAHSDEGLYKQYGQSHPEWFALQPDGRRFVPERYAGAAKLCLSNPALIRRRADDAIAELKKNPGLESIALSPSDGADWGFCTCKDCQSWDDPRGQKFTFRPTYDTPTFEYVSLSDRYARYYSAVAELIAKEYPKALVVGMAYGHYTPAPLKTKVHPNVVIEYVGNSSWQLDRDREITRKDLVGWGKAGAQLAWRPNWLAHKAWILVDPHALAADLKAYYRAGMRYSDFDTCVNDWGANGLDFYVLARLLWDPEQDVDAIIEDYLQKGFGPAAPAMRRYYDRLEKVTSKMTAETDPKVFWYYEVNRFWTPDVFRAAHEDLKEADQLAEKSPDAAAIRKRIDLCRQALEWQQIRLELNQAVKALKEGKGTRADVDAKLARRAAWVKEHVYTEAMPVPYIMYRDRRYREYYEP